MAAAEAVESFLLDQIGRGIEQRDTETLDQSTPGTVEFVCWLPNDHVRDRVHEVEQFLQSLRSLGVDVEPFSWRQQPSSEDGWVEAYKSHFRVTRIGRRFVVKPTWETHDAEPTERVIELDPGMAFGTGLHASTRLAMSAIERIERGCREAPQNVLDIGCGTGILAIAAARTWPRCRALAIDNDEIAVEACRANVERNGLSQRIRVEQRSGGDIGGRYEVILANLSYDVLLALRPKLRKGLNSAGRLVLSGLLADQAADIAGIYCDDLSLEPEYTEEQDGWRMVLLRVLR